MMYKVTGESKYKEFILEYLKKYINEVQVRYGDEFL